MPSKIDRRPRAALLDINMLVALTWPNHVHHLKAREWFDENSTAGWATSSITETGFVRVSSNHRVIDGAVSPAAALDVLRALCVLEGHQFWADDARLCEDPVDLSRLATNRQVTDTHLVALAASRRGRLATLDRGVVEALAPNDRRLVELVL